MVEHEDDHFLIDNAQPKRVEYILRCLGAETALSTKELQSLLASEWGVAAQRSLEYSLPRPIDLELAEKRRTSASKPGYVITSLGERVRTLLDTDRALYADIMHFLHYNGDSARRKIFWSYKRCCETVWAAKKVPAIREFVATIQSRIAEEYPDLYARKKGGNFNAGGVSAWKVWIKALEPSPIDKSGKIIIPRQSSHFELAALSLDHVYRSRDYRYGDPVILDDQLLDEVSRVFFLDPACCRELIDLAARLTKVIKLSDTFAGTSVTLLAPYGIEKI